MIEVPGDVSIAEAVHILAHHNIFSAPVTNPLASPTEPWSTRYLGMVDYPAVIMWVLEQAEIAAAAMATASTAAVGVGAGAFGALGAVVLGFTGPIAAASLAAAAVGAAIAGMHTCMKISDFISRSFGIHHHVNLLESMFLSKCKMSSAGTCTLYALTISLTWESSK